MQYKLKIQIEGITKPPVWRRLLVPAGFTFHKLHLAIQAAFGWENDHLYMFAPKGYGSRPVISQPSDMDLNDDVNSKKMELIKVFNKVGQTYTYIYDFGDDWTHKITIEEITSDMGIRAAFVDGKGATPPEDCGGWWGYENLKKVVSDPKHPDHDDMRDWMGLSDDEVFDINSFDKEKVSERVRRV